MLHHDHASEQTQEKKKKRVPVQTYPFGNTIIVEDEYEIPPDRSKQSEKPAVSEKIRHRLARMRSYLGISHSKNEGSNSTIATKRDRALEQQDERSLKKTLQEQQPMRRADDTRTTSMEEGAAGTNTFRQQIEKFYSSELPTSEFHTFQRQHDTSSSSSSEDEASAKASKQRGLNHQRPRRPAAHAYRDARPTPSSVYTEDLSHIAPETATNSQIPSSNPYAPTYAARRQRRDKYSSSSSEDEIDEFVLQRTYSSSTPYQDHIYFTVNARGHHMSKAESIEKIQQTDPKARDAVESFHKSTLPGEILKNHVSDMGVEGDRSEVATVRRKPLRDSQTTHLDQDSEIFDIDDILDIEDIPWDLFPDISRLRNFSKKPFDLGDGEGFATEELERVQDLLFLVSRDSHSFTQLAYMRKICLILDLIEQRQLLREFFRWGIDDDALPLPFARLKDILKHRKDASRVAEQFCTEQFRAVSRDWGNGAHHVMHRLEALPFRPLRSIGFGSQGSIDEVQLPNTDGTCARKKWIAGANLQKITARFDDEVKIIKKVAAHPHILELLASYTRGREFGLLLPVADCDLWHILTMSPSERRNIISNQSLIQSWGCLSSGLLFMHDKGIKHKDIKPQNIVLRRGDFHFTDFGLSKDISDLSHSATDSADRGTFRYMAPEVTEYQPQGRAADVFSLACVLFEIFSVWRGFSVDDADSFSALAPFHKNLSAIHSWIERELSLITPLSLLRYKNTKRIFESMFTHDPVDRPQTREVVFKMTMVSYPGDLFCKRCLDVALRHSKVPEGPEGTEFSSFSSMFF